MSAFAALGRYFHTVRHLRARQVYGRALFRVLRPAVDRRPAPPLAPLDGPWVWFPWRAPSYEAIGDGKARFSFLGEARVLGHASDWDDPRVPKLWRYNLHYFDDLTALAADARRFAHRELIARWIAENPAGRGTAWEPYPTSLRIVNWIVADLAAPARDKLLGDAARESLATQVRWLRQRLEHHLMGNHLWANAKALVAAGSYFSGAEADAWLADGAALFRAQLGEQVLADGGHYERSPMYHATMLGDALDLVAFARAYPARFPRALRDALEEAVPRMLRWLRVMTHPDGEIALFNDAAFGVAPTLATLEAQARALGVATADATGPLGPCEVLPDSGYVRLSMGGAVAICDVAPLGPDHLPAHGHADTLSFELSAGLDRLVVNGGTSTYESGPERERQRGTAAHSTVVVDGQDSSEVWASFRVARRARARLLAAGVQDGVAFAEGEHDGYLRLPGRVRHRRRWELADGTLMVRDWVDGTYREAIAHFLVAPGVLSSPGFAVHAAPIDMVDWRRTTWHPRFGAAEVAERATIPLYAGRLETRITWR